MTSDVLRGAVKLDGFVEEKCFKNWAEFLTALPSLLALEIPDSITNVTIGNTQPTDDQRDNLWIRKDSSGSFVGFYLYAQGTWQKIFPADNELNLVSGDSRVISPGYTLATDLTDLTTAQKAALQSQWHIGGTSPTWYDIFHVRYTGF